MRAYTKLYLNCSEIVHIESKLSPSYDDRCLTKPETSRETAGVFC